MKPIEYIEELERRKIQFEDRNDFINWIYEYAVQTAEFEKIDPKKAVKYVDFIMCQRLKEVLAEADKIYNIFPDLNRVVISKLNLERIPLIVSNEHNFKISFLEEMLKS